MRRALSLLLGRGTQPVFACGGQNGSRRYVHHDGAILLVAVMSVLAFGVSPCRASTPPLPKKLTANITDLTPLAFKPGPNAVVFFGEQSRHPQNKKPGPLLDYTKDELTPTQMAVTVTDAQEIWRTITIDSYFVTTSWISKAFLVQLIEPDDIPGGGNGSQYWIDNQITGSAGDDQTAMFFQGRLDGRKQTFLIIATRQYPITPPGKMPTLFPNDPLPTIITVYQFYAGENLATYEPNLDSGPSFLKLDQFEPSTHYCSSTNAIAFELQPAFTPATAKAILNYPDGTPHDDAKACTGDQD